MFDSFQIRTFYLIATFVSIEDIRIEEDEEKKNDRWFEKLEFN